MSDRFEAHNVELIKEAWGAYEYDDGAGWDLVSRLATALEDAVMRIDEAAKLHQPFDDVPSESFCKTCQRVEGFWPCSTIQALDGAPEPEWEWGVRASGDDEPFSDVYQTREHLAEHETGIAWGEEQLVRRRPAGPWLPVEGESK